MANPEEDIELREIQSEYLNFLDDEQNQGIYQTKIQDMIKEEETRLIVNINELRRRNPNRARGLVENGFEEMIAFERALRELVASADPMYAKKYSDFHIGLTGSFGSKHLTPRSLSATYLSNMICIEGIVTKCSLVRPKVVKSVHYCPTTKKTSERKYTDMTSLDPFPSSAAYPTKDDDGNLLETEFGLSSYKDHQTFSVQEMPEKAPAGQLPRSVDVIVDDDLVDQCKPGDRVQVVGIYRCLPGKKNGFTSATFRTILISNNIILTSKESAPEFSAQDIQKIKKFSKHEGDVFEVLSHSLAPSIHGHEFIKKAVLCMLLGGTEKLLENGSRLRGDINILLIGDPSVAKSQMLRYVIHSAPRAIATTGRGSSGVGLTAAVTTDQESGERRLEAGAMVLADRGVVCIDEFDKMSDLDRTAIHEVMEQGRVTIAKAGIHAKLNARCSVLAAANPVYGRYDQYKSPMENIGLQDSLLSRFDLLFIVLDTMEAESDRRIAEHVLRMHRYRKAGEQDGEPLARLAEADILSTDNPDIDINKETQIYEKHDSMLHGKKTDKEYVSLEFMRKYIHVARELKPILTRKASSLIAEEYSKLRSQENSADNIARTTPVTARTLETMIRLSTAHAKARLSNSISLADAKSAVELIQYAYFKRVLKKDKRQRTEDSSDDDNDEDEQPTKRRVTKRKRRERKEGEEGEDDPYDFDSAEEAAAEEEITDKLTLRKKSVKLSAEKLEVFRKELSLVFREAHVQLLGVDVVIEEMNKRCKDVSFNKEEVVQACETMMEANQVMYADDTVFLI